MGPFSISDMVWIVLVLSALVAEVLERAPRPRVALPPVARPAVDDTPGAAPH